LWRLPSEYALLLDGDLIASPEETLGVLPLNPRLKAISFQTPVFAARRHGV